MPSLTPLHETYCKWDRTPPSQADLLEGVAQVVSTPLNHVARELIQTIQHEVISSVFGISRKKSTKLKNNPKRKDQHQTHRLLLQTRLLQ